MAFPIGGFGAPGTPAILEFIRRFRATAAGLLQVNPVGAGPAGVAMVAGDRYHLASRTGKRTNAADPYTMRPQAEYAGGVPTTAPSSLLGGVIARNLRPNPANGALGNTNVMQEFGANTIYDGKLPMMPLWRAMPYAKVPPKLPGLSTAPSTLAASGFVDPYRAGAAGSNKPIAGGLRWTP